MRLAIGRRREVRSDGRAGAVLPRTSNVGIVNQVQGDSPGKNLAKTVGSTGGGEAGVLVGGAACEAATLAIGTPGCIAAVVIGSVVIGIAGEHPGGWIYDHVHFRAPGTNGRIVTDSAEES